tara:strand:+ start:3763 stop:3999 length:237 start_codon:yes stop_codon:yes gene_type:complete
MQTKFKKHQNVKLLRNPNPEYIEYSPEYSESPIPITKGMSGKINLILPNGQYHVEILDSDSTTVAYVKVDEEEMEAID